MRTLQPVHVDGLLDVMALRKSYIQTVGSGVANVPRGFSLRNQAGSHRRPTEVRAAFRPILFGFAKEDVLSSVARLAPRKRKG